MRKNRTRLAVLGLAALALGAIVGPGSAQAAKVSESEGPITVPDAVDVGPQTIYGEGSMTFNLRGKKVTRKQILDVDLTLNATGGAAGALGGLQVFLTKGPIGTAGVPTPGGTVWSNLEFSDQSDFTPCNPVFEVHSDCNYLQGGTTFSGDLESGFNPVFKGGNPKGRWTLTVQDAFTGTFDNPGTVHPPTTISAELEVKTGNRFAKE